MRTVKPAFCAALAAAFSLLHAQSSSPTAYTITQAAMGGGTSTVYRSGSKALVETRTAEARGFTLYDLSSKSDWTWNPDDKAGQCSSGTFSGDWGDPFAMTADLSSSIAKGEYKPAGMETIAGIPAQIYTGNSDQVTMKIWFDAKDQLVLRAVMTMAGSAPTTMADIRKVSFTQPPASLFALPAGCTAFRPPPTPNQAIADVTGGDDPANYVDSIYGTPSTNSCNIVLKVLHAMTMTPVSNIQVFIDTAHDQNPPPHYTINVGQDGRETYSGNTMKEFSSPAHNGVFDLGKQSAHFMLNVHVVAPNGIDGTALVYRQCFAPTTVLLYLVRDSIDNSQGPHWLWVKSGKYATP